MYSCTILMFYRNNEYLIIKNEINIAAEETEKKDESIKENQNKSYSEPLIFNKKKNKEHTKEDIKHNSSVDNGNDAIAYDGEMKYKNKRPFYDHVEETENDIDISIEGEFDSYNKNKKKLGAELVQTEAKEVLKQVSLSEKKKLITFAYKVPKKEFNNIVKYLNYENKDLGVKKILSVLEKYLTEEEIKEAKEIAKPFMNKEITEEF